MNITENQSKAAGDVVELIANKLGNNRLIHSATAISACARLSGSMLFRSFEFPNIEAEPGNVILSEEANNKGPVLINILGGMIESTGNKIDKNKLQTSNKVESNIDFLKTLDLLQSSAVEVKEKYKLSFEDFSYSCAMATAFIITQCKNDVSIESGFNTAIYGFIEGSKTMPPKIECFVI